MSNVALNNIPLCEEDGRQQQQNADQRNRNSYNVLLAINYVFLFVGSVSSTLISKFYFIHKGSSRWVSTWVQSAGFPLLILPILSPYCLFKYTSRKPFSGFTRNLWISSLFIGFMLGLNNLLISWANSYLLVSTLSLLLSCQLVFVLILSVLIVKQKITLSNMTCVVLLTLSSILLALGSKDDKQKEITRTEYFLGYISAIGAGLLFALYLPVMETMYRKVDCYAMVMEMQLIMQIAATLLATVGLAFDGGLSEMEKESSEVFDLGPKAYWLTVFSSTVTWQLCMMGTAGMVFLTTSLTGGVCMTALTAVNVLAGVVFYGDKFGGEKVVSTLLCVWGFSSYLFGLYKKMKDEEEGAGTDECNGLMEGAGIISQND